MGGAVIGNFKRRRSHQALSHDHAVIVPSTVIMLARQPTGRSFLRNDNSARVASEPRNAKEPRISERIHGLLHAD
ncbi:hypothetical protein CBM2634_U280004 [Cupriavidus taiwanensis]|uniref:Uncharacterized protein n=1 Tax=Cupriavidus taiwanensis TaxID=164546 RepID=A0A375JCB5_9BURK|nr:hypothetical protein CBM2634_U280004 [Cupriavidus taiwanensis]